MSEEIWNGMVEDSHNMSNVCDPCYQIFKVVNKLPHVQVATRNHVYITPDGRMWALNRKGDGYTDLTEKDSIVIDSPDKSITVVKETQEGEPTTFHLNVSDLIQNAIKANTAAIGTKQDKINIKTGQGLVGINDELTPRNAISEEELAAGTDEVPSVVSPAVLKRAIDKLVHGAYKAGANIEISEDGTISANVNGEPISYTAQEPLKIEGSQIKLGIDTDKLVINGELLSVKEPTVETGEFIGNYGAHFYYSKLGKMVMLRIYETSINAASSDYLTSGNTVPKNLRPYDNVKIFCLFASQHQVYINIDKDGTLRHRLLRTDGKTTQLTGQLDGYAFYFTK